MKRTAISDFGFVFFVTLLFYLCLWLFGFSNKAIFFAFGVLFLIYLLKVGNSRTALLLTYLASTVVFTGKTYIIDMFPQIPVFDPRSESFIVNFVIAPSNIISLFMLFFLGRDLILGKIRNTISVPNVIIILFFILTFAADLLFSVRPVLSFIFNLLSLKSLILYFYLQYNSFRLKKTLPLILSLFCAITIFETGVVIDQYLHNSPKGSSLEAVTDYSYAGESPDEPYFVYRPAGTFNHTNQLATYSVHVAVLLLCFYFYSNNILYLISIVASGIIFSLTVSRASWLAFALATVLMFFYMYRSKYLRNRLTSVLKPIWSLGLSFAILFMLFMVPRTINSVDTFSLGGGRFRIEQVKNAIALMGVNNFWGVGTKMSIPYAYEVDPGGYLAGVFTNIHNWFISTSLEYGIVSQFVFMAFMVITLNSVFKIGFETKGTIYRYAKIAVIANTVVLIVIGLFQTFPGEYFVFLMYGLIDKYDKV